LFKPAAVVLLPFLVQKVVSKTSYVLHLCLHMRESNCNFATLWSAAPE